MNSNASAIEGKYWASLLYTYVWQAFLYIHNDLINISNQEAFTECKQLIHHLCLFAFAIPTDGLSLMNDAGGLSVFFPNNSFVINTTLTHTNSPRGERHGAPRGNDHIVCYGDGRHTTRVTWSNSSGLLEECPQPCRVCGDRCVRNGGVGADPALHRRTHIHMYTALRAYVNQVLECRTFGRASSSIFIGVYLKDGGEYIP